MFEKNTTTIKALTGVRALAALVVFFHHFPLQEKWVCKWGHQFFIELYIGVSVFFVLSGFLIYIRYAEKVSTTSKWLFNYFKNRMARIYPVYFLLTTITFIYYYFHPNTFVIFNQQFWYTYVSNIFFVRGFSQNLFLTGVAQGWTLTVEETFYCLAPFIFIALKKSNIIKLIFIVYAVGLVLFFIGKAVNYNGYFLDGLFMLYATFFGRCFEFFVGIQLGIWYLKNKKYNDNKNLCTVVGSAFIFLVICCLIAVKQQRFVSIYTLQGVLINNLILPIAIAIFLWGIIHEKTWLQKFLETKLLQYFGKISYTFYLVHLGLFSEWLYKNITNNYLYNFPFLVLISIVIYETVEKPLHKKITTFSFGKR